MRGEKKERMVRKERQKLKPVREMRRKRKLLKDRKGLRRKVGKKRTAKCRKGCADGDMNNCQLHCAKYCYLLWQRQKSSPPSTAITTSPLSAGATGRVTGFTKEVVRA